MILLTGPRQVGKTTLCRQQMAGLDAAQYLNWDIASDRAIRQRDLRQEKLRSDVQINDEAQWLAGLNA